MRNLFCRLWPNDDDGDAGGGDGGDDDGGVVDDDDLLGDLWIELKESRLSWSRLDIDKSCIGRKGGHSECG